MKLRITKHAKIRMRRYEISKSTVKEGIENPDSVVEGHSGRKIAQKRLNEHVLRIVFEKEKDKSVIVTVYKSRSGRYEV